MIHIPENLLEEIFAHARREAPNEVCGWLAGFIHDCRESGCRAARRATARRRATGATLRGVGSRESRGVEATAAEGSGCVHRERVERKRGSIEEESVESHPTPEASGASASPLPTPGFSVERAYPVPNVAEAPISRFVMEPESQIAAMREIRRSGLEVVGTYHSHPGCAARLSEKDRELGLYPALAHLIVSLAEFQPTFRCWRISEDGVFEVEVERGGRVV